MTKRIDCIHSSAIRKVFDKAAAIKDVVDLSIGQPDFTVPEEVKDSLIKAIKDNKTKYTQTAGIPSLKEKILQLYPKLKDKFGAIITSGTSGGILLSFSAILEEGDELLILEPYFMMYPDLCSFLNAKPVIVETNNDFSLNLDNIQRAITPKTRAIIINSPNNPTGSVYSKDEIKKLAAIAKKNNLWIISDEVYSDFDYDSKFISIADIYDKSIVLGGFSKNYAMTGLRIGYALAPKDIIEDMAKIQQYTFVCAPSISQFAVDENLGKVDFKDRIDLFRKRRDFVYSNLKDYYPLFKPAGAFYVYIELPRSIDENDFIERCLANKLLVVPGSAFSSSRKGFRISYAVSQDTLEKAMAILKKVSVEFKLNKK